MSMRYVDRDGNPISMERFAELFGDEDYKRIGRDVLGPYEVSTIWLGIDLGAPFLPEMRYETMVFSPWGIVEEYRWRSDYEASHMHVAVASTILKRRGRVVGEQWSLAPLIPAALLGLGVILASML